MQKVNIMCNAKNIYVYLIVFKYVFRIHKMLAIKLTMHRNY